MEDGQYRELLKRIAELTARVYKLEQLAGVREVRPVIQRAPDPEQQLGSPPKLFATPIPKSEPHDALESRIGGHWLNRLGIVAVLIGVSFFLKYAFENEWVGPSGRVVIGLAAGLFIVLWSEIVRAKGYDIFSYSLKALGIGVLYLSLWASSQLYHLIPISMAFFAMGVVTAATVALALWQDAAVIAAFGAVGAFITPVVLSTGVNNAAGLFTYIAILDIGALVILRYRPWERVFAGSFLGTLILYIAWHNQFYGTDQFETAFTFVSIFFVVFAAAPWVMRTGQDSWDAIGLILANAAACFVEVHELYADAGRDRSSAVAAVALGFGYFLMASHLASRAPQVTSYIHWSVGIALMIVAVPIGLDAPWITVGWFVEAGALAWIYRRTEAAFLKYFVGVALALGVARLILIDNFDVTRIAFNERIATFAVAIAVLAFVARGAASIEDEEVRHALPILSISINVVALLALNEEIRDAFRRQVVHADSTTYQSLSIVRDFAYSALWMTYGAGLMVVGFWKKSQFLRWQALVLIAITIVKVFAYDTQSLDRGYRILSLIALGIILLATSFLYQRHWFLTRNGEPE